MRLLTPTATVLSLAFSILANPIPLADELRAEGRSEHEILAQLGARHPTPSLGEADALSSSLLKRDAEPEEETQAMPGTQDASVTVVVDQIIWRTLAGAKRGLAYVEIVRDAEPETDAYEGMEYKRPEYTLRLRA